MPTGAECCASPLAKSKKSIPESATKHEFLVAKARNFRDYIQQYKPSAEVAKYIANFREDSLMTTLYTVVVPIVKGGATASAVKDLVTQLHGVPESERAEVEAKMTRYLEMFSTVALTP